jgi:hypothetical protein
MENSNAGIRFRRVVLSYLSQAYRHSAYCFGARVLSAEQLLAPVPIANLKATQ